MADDNPTLQTSASAHTIMHKHDSTHSMDSTDSNNKNNEIRQKQIARGSQTPNPTSTLKYRPKHKTTLSPATAKYLSDNHSSSFPDIDLNNDDCYSLSEKKKKKRVSMQKWKRTISSDNLLNTARSISSYKSRAITKIKNKNTEIRKDSSNIRQSKNNLESFNTMNDIKCAAQKLYDMQLKHLDKMNEFSSTIHSSIDLGRSRGAANKHYFGQYLKMMATTMHSIQQIYSEYTSNLNEFLIEPLEIISEGDEMNIVSNHLQIAKNYRYEYSKIKHAYNSNPTSKAKLELENIEEKFIHSTNELIKERDKSLRFPMDNYQQCFYEFAQKRAKYINDKITINGYDEMKANKDKIENQIQKEMVYINSNKQFNEYLNKYKRNENDKCDDNNYCILLFHRDKFPPSMRFLIDIFAPLADKYNNNSNIEFINVHYKCRDILDKYDVNSFPTCLVFINGIISNHYKPIIGNGNMQRNELESIVKEITEKINGPNNETRRMAVDRQMF